MRLRTKRCGSRCQSAEIVVFGHSCRRSPVAPGRRPRDTRNGPGLRRSSRIAQAALVRLLGPVQWSRAYAQMGHPRRRRAPASRPRRAYAETWPGRSLATRKQQCSAKSPIFGALPLPASAPPVRAKYVQLGCDEEQLEARNHSNESSWQRGARGLADLVVHRPQRSLLAPDADSDWAGEDGPPVPRGAFADHAVERLLSRCCPLLRQVELGEDLSRDRIAVHEPVPQLGPGAELKRLGGRLEARRPALPV